MSRSHIVPLSNNIYTTYYEVFRKMSNIIIFLKFLKVKIYLELRISYDQKIFCKILYRLLLPNKKCVSALL